MSESRKHALGALAVVAAIVALVLADGFVGLITGVAR